MISKIDLSVSVLGLAGFLVFVLLWHSAFPSASIELRLTSGEALLRAREFIQQEGLLDLADYESVVIFHSYTEAIDYIDRNLGIDALSEIAAQELPVWYWLIRYFKPLEIEEISVGIDPSNGKLSSFNHILPEDSPGANLEQDQAIIIAESFISLQGIDLLEYDLVRSSSERRKARTDHQFEWEKRNYTIGEARLRLQVNIHGDKIGHYSKYLKIPEEILRETSRELSHGMILAQVSGLFWILILICSLIVFIRAYKQARLFWRFGLILGAIAALLIILQTFNEFPLAMAFYPTEIEKSVFLSSLLISSVIFGLLTIAQIVLAGAAGEAISSQVIGDKMPIIRSLMGKKLPSKELFLASIRGYGIGFGFLGYITLFYLVGRNYFGVWVPPEVNYSEMLSTALPFLFPLTVGILAALTEEFVFRFFSIPFFKKSLRFTPLALLLPAMIWGFGHSAYPVSPVYLRGMELTIAGVIFGYLFLVYNLETLLIAHYVIDSAIISLPLLTSTNMYFLISGIVVVGLMLLPALIAISRYGWSQINARSN